MSNFIANIASRSMERQSQVNISDLPRDMLYHILSYACQEPKNIVQVSLVCKEWKKALENRVFWETIAKTYLEIRLNSNIHPRQQVQVLFQQLKMYYSQDIITLVGGLSRLAQIPTIELPRDYISTPFEDHFKVKYQGRNPIAKFFIPANNHLRPALGIRYVHASQNSSLVEGVFLLFPRASFWTYRDTMLPEMLLDLRCQRRVCFQWLKKLLSGAPCGELSIQKLNELHEGSAFNANNKPVYQLWSSTNGSN